MADRHKLGGHRIIATDRSKTHRPADSVKALLSRVSPTLTRVSDQASRQSRWRSWLSQQLPGELYPRISGVVERDGQLVIFAESAAWSARLRYAVVELEAAIRAFEPQIQQIRVRVLPK